MPEEVRFFGRSAAFAIAVGIIYWFLSYEWAGTVLLLGFGLAGLVATWLLWRDSRRSAGDQAARPWSWIGLSSPTLESPFPSDEGRLPGPTLAPLGAGFGLALILVGLVLGPWLILVGLVPLVWSARVWLREAMGEWRVMNDGGAAAEPEPRPSSVTGPDAPSPGRTGPDVRAAAGRGTPPGAPLR